MKSPELSNIEFTITYQENGRIKDIGKYIDGYKEGEWKEYDENGKLEKIEEWSKGEKIGSRKVD